MSDRYRPARTALVIGGGIAGPVVAVALRRAGIEATVYEARATAADEVGSWLGLGPNGINALETLGIAGAVKATSAPLNDIVFANSQGKRIGVIDRRGDGERYGARGVVLKRGQLHRALREEAIGQGVAIELGKKLVGIDAIGDRGVTARFEDGTSETADVLIGCDGIHSRTRRLMLPDSPEPAFTGVVGWGGCARPTRSNVAPGSLVMTFVKRAFFGYFANPDGEVYWFSNVPWPKEPPRDEPDADSTDGWRRMLLGLHRDDPAPIPEIIGATAGEIGRWVIHDIPFLPAWHRGRVCLVGDAAHATSPHAGQGASMALEDAVVLAKCLRDVPSPEIAFAAYQRLRKDRVEKMAMQARRNGKIVVNPIAGWFRDRLMPLFLRRGIGATDWAYGYKVDWGSRVAA